MRIRHSCYPRVVSNYILLVLFAIAMYVYMLFVMLLNNLFPFLPTRGSIIYSTWKEKNQIARKDRGDLSTS